jgi:uncharacterized protein (TIGR03435 family)
MSKLNLTRTLIFLTGAMALLLPAVEVHESFAQSPSPGKLEFEVASVRQNKSDGKSSMNVDPTSGDSFTPTGGLYLAKNIVLVSYISFAYKLTNKQLQSVVAQAPWTAEDRFDIEARAAGEPIKDQYRSMMQSLLADRFKMAVHFETREVSIYSLVLTKPGELGPQLRLHLADDTVCSTPTTPAHGPIQADSDGFPLFCGGPVRMKPSTSGRMKDGGRNVPLARFAAITTAGVGGVDRPVVDQTGIKESVDYYLEWQQIQANVPFGSEFHPDESAPTFDEALRQQLGLKLVPQKGPIDFFVIDHIEHPSEN